MSIQILEDIVNEYEKRLQAQPIDGDTFASWKNHACTKRLENECIRAALETMIEHEGDPMDDIDVIALRANYIRGLRDAFDMVVNWIPGELDNDD